jgi:DNA invertase Pin-like site-specific DNA recombinase
MISKRTKEALAAAKARGVRLGKPENLSREHLEAGRAIGRATRSKIAGHRARDLAPVIADLRSQGTRTLRDIAAGLNARGIPTPRGGTWSAVQVMRVLGRAGQ